MIRNNIVCLYLYLSFVISMFHTIYYLLLLATVVFVSMVTVSNGGNDEWNLVFKVVTGGRYLTVSWKTKNTSLSEQFQNKYKKPRKRQNRYP